MEGGGSGEVALVTHDSAWLDGCTTGSAIRDGGAAIATMHPSEQQSMQCLAASWSPECGAVAGLPAWQMTLKGSMMASAAARAATKLAIRVEMAMVSAAASATARRDEKR
jgi:hypothetical protein